MYAMYTEIQGMRFCLCDRVQRKESIQGTACGFWFCYCLAQEPLPGPKQTATSFDASMTDLDIFLTQCLPFDDEWEDVA